MTKFKFSSTASEIMLHRPFNDLRSALVRYALWRTDNKRENVDYLATASYFNGSCAFCSIRLSDLDIAPDSPRWQYIVRERDFGTPGHHNVVPNCYVCRTTRERNQRDQPLETWLRTWLRDGKQLSDDKINQNIARLFDFIVHYRPPTSAEVFGPSLPDFEKFMRNVDELEMMGKELFQRLERRDAEKA